MAKTKEAVAHHVVEATCGRIEIAYEASPRRHYKARAPITDDPGVKEMTDWVEVPSVTTVLDVLSKDGLPWWGMKIGIEGVLKQYGVGGFITPTITPDGGAGALAVWNGTSYETATVENVVSLLTRQKLTVNHVRDQAGSRGNSVHDALQGWIEEGVMPSPDLYPPEEQGYVIALCAFLNDVGEVTARRAEVMVASVEHGFAGRYDFEGNLKGANLVVKRASPTGKVPEVRKEFKGLSLLDLKTSKGVYASHKLQLEGYEIARREGGLKPTVNRLVIQVSDDGTYAVTESNAEADDFLNVLAAYYSIAKIK